MKIKALVLSIILGGCSTVFAGAPLSCEAIKGDWRGNMTGLIGTRLNIHADDGREVASIAFYDEDQTSREYGLIVGTCQQNTNGDVTMHLYRNSWGVQFDAYLRLINQSTLEVKSLTYRDNFSAGSGEGTLSR